MSPVIKYLLFAGILLATFSLDVGTKQWAKNELKGKPTVTLIKGYLDLSFAENRGMVFGILNNNQNHIAKKILLVVRILILLGVLVFVYINIRQTLWFHIPFLLIIAGAAGNIIDNLLYGPVIDFIHIHAGTVLNWPFLFNLADAYLCVGMVLLVLLNKKGSFDKVLSKS
jgi:signal peptidase II